MSINPNAHGALPRLNAETKKLMVAAAASAEAPLKPSIITFLPRQIMLGKKTMNSQKEKSGKDVICSQERGNIPLLSAAAHLHTEGFSNTLSTLQSEAASEPKTAKTFQNVKVDEVKFEDEQLQDNSYWAKEKKKSQFSGTRLSLLY